MDDLYWQAVGTHIDEKGFELLNIALKDEEDEKDKKLREKKESNGSTDSLWRG